MKQIEMFPKRNTMEQAAVSIPCVDKWPPGALTDTKMRAYKMAEQSRLISIEKVEISRSTDSAVVRYKSAIPQEWVRDLMREEAGV